MMTSSRREFYYDIDMGQYEGTFDAHILKEILRKLASNPSFSHFSAQTIEGKLKFKIFEKIIQILSSLSDYTRIGYEGEFMEEFSEAQTTNFIDYYGNDNHNSIDYEENL